MIQILEDMSTDDMGLLVDALTEAIASLASVKADDVDEAVSIARRIVEWDKLKKCVNDYRLIKLKGERK